MENNLDTPKIKITGFIAYDPPPEETSDDTDKEVKTNSDIDKSKEIQNGK